MKPTIGRIVIYKLNEWDVQRVKEFGDHNGNYYVSLGQEFPLIIVRVWPDEYGTGVPGVNGQVILDGRERLWITSAKEGTEPGTWNWPERV